jgi:transposase
MIIITIGLNLAKNVFAINWVDVEGHVLARRELRRSQVLPFFARQNACLVGRKHRREPITGVVS